jgi:hypothetical protein
MWAESGAFNGLAILSISPSEAGRPREKHYGFSFCSFPVFTNTYSFRDIVPSFLFISLPPYSVRFVLGQLSRYF